MVSPSPFPLINNPAAKRRVLTISVDFVGAHFVGAASFAQPFEAEPILQAESQGEAKTWEAERLEAPLPPSEYQAARMP